MEDHQSFEVGEFTLYSHDYDGDVLQLVRRAEGASDQIAIDEATLAKALLEIWNNRKLHRTISMEEFYAKAGKVLNGTTY